MCFKKYRVFPILIYSPGDKNIQVTECCYALTIEDPIHLECGHGFHIKCILKWFEKKWNVHLADQIRNRIRLKTERVLVQIP